MYFIMPQLYMSTLERDNPNINKIKIFKLKKKALAGLRQGQNFFCYFLRYFVKSIATATAMITPLMTCCHIGETFIN